MVLTWMKAGGCHLHREEISTAAVPLLPQSLTDESISFPPKEHVPVSLLSVKGCGFSYSSLCGHEAPELRHTMGMSTLVACHFSICEAEARLTAQGITK